MENDDLPKLLYAIAGGTQAQENKQDIIFKAAAAEIDRLRAALTKIRYLEASDADTWIWQAQEEAREALDHEQEAPRQAKQPATVAELDALLNSEDDREITINPDGSITEKRS